MQNNPELIIVKVAIPCPLRRLFDYIVPPLLAENLKPGCRVKAPWRNGHKIGVVVEISDNSDLPLEKIKTLKCVIDDKPVVDPEIMQLCKFASDYYQYNLGEVLQYALPKALREDKLLPPIPATKNEKAETKISKTDCAENSVLAKIAKPLQPTSEQEIAIKSITKASDKFQSFLLHGVTGSGKTEVYLQVIEHVLQQGKQALLLVPEISLTPQTIKRVKQRFCKAVQPLHSRMTEKQRLQGWQRAQAGLANIIIGTRSALFTPMQNLGVIIIDEEHDLSFKQQDGFRYCARDLAIYRAKQLNIPLVLGSATPSLETLNNAKAQRFEHLKLLERAGNAVLPATEIIDLKQHKPQHGLTTPALNAIRNTLSNGKQVLIFLNRRGYSPSLYCSECCWVAKCVNCERPFTYHQQEHILRCHHCNARQGLPNACPQCRAKKIIPLSLGTERIEDYLKSKLPDVLLTRIDRDTTSKKGSLDKLLENAAEDGPQILIGTQMLAKGHHFPNLMLVVVVDADQALYSGDIFALERLGQLLTQVAGRAGRDSEQGTVLVQTRFPDNRYLQQLLTAGYADFADSLLQERELAQLPPFAHLAIFRAEAKHINEALEFLEQLRGKHQEVRLETKLLGPMPASMPKRQGMFRAQLLLQSDNRKTLHIAVKTLLQFIEEKQLGSRLRWSVDVDPKEFV